MDVMPKWVDIIVVPLFSLFLAAALSALLILAIGESPIAALDLMIEGTLFRSAGWGYMLYYTTNFIFTGLAVSVAFHAALFNIGGEGQAMIGGLGVALVCLFIPMATLDISNRRSFNWCRSFWNDLGWPACLPSSQKRKSYRYYHDYV